MVFLPVQNYTFHNMSQNFYVSQFCLFISSLIQKRIFYYHYQSLSFFYHTQMFQILSFLSH